MAEQQHDWDSLARSLAELLARGGIEVHEDGRWLADLDGAKAEIRTQGSSYFIHIWSDSRNLTLRILRAEDVSPSRICLEVIRFGLSRSVRLEVLHKPKPRPGIRVSRQVFSARFKRLLAEQFPDSHLESLSVAPDLEHSFSGRFPRGILAESVRHWAILGVPPGEELAGVEQALTFGLLWLDWNRRAGLRHPAFGLRLILPRGASRVLSARAAALAPSAHLELYEMDEPIARLELIDPRESGNLQSFLVPRREGDAPLDAITPLLLKLRSFLAEDAPSLSAVPLHGGSISLRFRGLEFAAGLPDSFSFGPLHGRLPLIPERWHEFELYLSDLRRYRSAPSPDTRNTLYRLSPERWLESLIASDPRALDVRLDPRFLYPQVLSTSGGGRGIADLVGITRSGRLVVIEVKASEDIHLPIQALDYWLRIRQLQQSGSFLAAGYFPAIELAPRPPLIWLVAPALQFHPSTDIILRYVTPQAEFSRIGINEDWRRELKVVLRQ
jgi:hypothetical protein